MRRSSGHGRTAEAHHPTDPHPEGIGYKSALRRAFRHARMHPEEIDYINAHGSATPKNDPIETAAIKEVFGSHARRLAVSATKAITGHLMGASGAVESVVAILAVKNQHIPPTINLTEPDRGVRPRLRHRIAPLPDPRGGQFQRRIRRALFLPDLQAVH